jgi:hypothetical protein
LATLMVVPRAMAAASKLDLRMASSPTQVSA